MYYIKYNYFHSILRFSYRKHTQLSIIIKHYLLPTAPNEGSWWILDGS